MANACVITTEALIKLFQQALDEKWGYIYKMTHVKWSEARQKQYNTAYATNPDCQLSIEYGSKWYGHWVTDCSGLFAWAFKELGGTMYHGSDTMYRKWTVDKGSLKNGKKSNGQELEPGTAVFVWKSEKKRYTHVGLYIGNGNVCEAAGTKKGVCISKVTDKKWTNWGTLKGVKYTNTDPQPAPEPEPEPKQKPTLKRGSKGSYVTLLQTELINKGYSCGPQGADGDFGSNTEKAVKAFQAEHDGPDGRALKVDGIVGQATWWALENAPERMTYTVTIKHLTAEQKNKLMKEYPGATMAPEN